MSGEKIPDDVMQAAAGLAEALIAALQDGVCGCPECRMVASEHIARAIMAERSARDERAAQIVERDAEDYWDVSCVAAAIRGER